MSRAIVILALLGLVACKGKEPAGTRGSASTPSGSPSTPSSPSSPPSSAPSAAALAEAPASEGHVGMQDAAKAFADAWMTGDPVKIRSEMPPRAELAKYFTCDTIAKKLDDAAVRALETAAPKGATFITIEDFKTDIVERDFEGCPVTEEIRIATLSTKWKIEGGVHMTGLQLVRLGKRWYTFDVPDEPAPEPE